MAISGLHIAFAALLAAGLIRSDNFLPVRDSLATPLLGGILARYVMPGYRLTTACAAHGGALSASGED